MRTVDFRNRAKRIEAYNKISPVCSSKPVFGLATEIRREEEKVLLAAGRMLLSYQGKRIRCVSGIGGLNEQGQPTMTDICSALVDEWLHGHKEMTVFIVEFSRGETGELSKLRKRLILALNEAAKNPKDYLLVLLCKNTTMLGKVDSLIGVR